MSVHNQATLVNRADLERAPNSDGGFDFNPPSDLGPRLIFLRADENSGKGFDSGISLFGRPAGAVDGDEDPFSPSNRYDLKNELGRGGMGVIYEATDTVLGRPVALKFILKGEATTREEFSQFLLEARAIAKLLHPNIVTIYDIGMMKSKHYIAMELVNGGSLANRLQERGRFTLVEALRFFVEIARGLQAAHEQGIVHRDVKPGNILLSDKDTVRLVDFGLATLQGKTGATNSSDPTLDNKFRHAGTPGFMAPEQIRGADPLPAADIYALGIIFYFMLAGEPPHKSASPSSVNDILAFQLKGIMPKLRDIRPDAPEAFEHLYRYCTVANPSDRYQSVDQFLGDSEKYLKAMT
jgi:serine/threonine-protein kinase